MSRFGFVAAYTVGLSVVSMAPAAWGSCGSANCFLVTGTQEGIAAPNQFVFDLSYRWIPMDDAQKGSDNASEAITPAIDFDAKEIVPDHHRELRTNNQLIQLDVSYGLSERSALTVSFPLVNDRWHEHVDLERDNNGNIVDEDFNAQSFKGFGDVRLIGKYALHLSTKHLFVAGVGVKAPTGEYKLRNDLEGTINEPTIMPGTGSWDALVSAYYVYQLRPHRWDWFLSGSYQVTTENDLDYEFGDTLIVNTGTNYLFDYKEKSFAASLQVNGRYAPRDEYRGEEVASTGGTWIYLTPGVRVYATPNTSLYVHVQYPIYQRVNDTNLVPRYGLVLGMSHSF